MSDEERIQDVLDAVLSSQRTPEEVCASDPELLREVRIRWERVRRVEYHVDALFPPDEPTQRYNRTYFNPEIELPAISGYEVESILGRGGAGVVFKARHLRLNRLVALKMLLAGAYAGPEELARFRREAEAVAALRHPNIIQVFDAGEVGGRPYFTMEFVAGGSLAQKLSGTPQPARPAAALVAALAAAMRVAHQGGIIHRDLKPANILLKRKADTPNPKSQIRDAKSESASPPPLSDSEFRISDFDPKIADFGLARHFDAGPDLTLSGARVGTPSYMAPEQALGKTRAIGPAVDIYALGTVLYELLTGRPPFRGETSAETALQVIDQEPVPPSRLNAKVPRDLETICLTCLHKIPERRYATAAALAEDLHRFQRGEPIAACSAGLPERTGKWVRRNPTMSGGLAAGLGLAVLFVSWGLSFATQRARQRDAVAMDLGVLTALQANARWTEARAVLDRAEARLEGRGPDDLRQRLDRARHDLDLATHLDGIRLQRANRGELDYYRTRADHEYAATFQQSGLGTRDDSPADVATRIAASPVSGALVAALYDWSVCAADRAQRGWLLQVARQADSIPGDWHERVLDPAVWENRQALVELTEAAPVASERVSLLLALGQQLRMAGGNAVPFLRRVQQEYPADFWSNLAMGNALLPDAPRQAVGALRAALASRPDAAVGYCAVGECFQLQQDWDTATGFFEKALRLDPTYARTYNDLGVGMQARGRMDEAIALHRKAVQLDPDYALAHDELGKALRAIGRLDEAHHHMQEALRRDPQNPEVLNGVRCLLMRQGRSQEVQADWRTALMANPPGHGAWFGYAELCLYLGQTEEYRRATRALLDRFGDTNDAYVAERVGRACLLLPGLEGEVKQAAALTDRAAAILGPTPPRHYAYSRFALGLAQYRLRRWDSAIAIMKFEAADVMGPGPRLVVAMALHRDGQRQAARQTLAAAVLAYDWRAAQAENRDAWICHILRREAEQMILPNMPAFLDGNYQPEDNDERLALLGICQFTNRTRAMARLYADAFAAYPPLVDDLGAGHRYGAARVAALAGCGHGKDASGLGEAERRKWLDQSRQWLRADLAARVRALDTHTTAARVGVREALTRWHNEPDLACVREPGELSKLAADERKDYLTLWAEVGAVLARTDK
jgi:serine/threonine-protein kinase